MNKQEAQKIFNAWNPSDEQKLETYIKMFPEQFEKFAQSDRAKVKGLVERDLLSLGEALQRQTMLPIREEVSFAQLGAMPTLALDFITALFGKSVIPYIASEQTIDDIQGLVYFENIIAQTTRGNIETSQSFTLAYAPIRENYVTIMCDGKVATDDGKGNLIGNGLSGTINYSTGEVSLTFAAAPTSGQEVVANYATNFELGELPTITTKLDSKIVRANVYGLQTDTSVISSYIMAKRFSFDMQNRAVQILQEQILNEITTDLIRKIESAVTEYNLDLTQFNCTVPVGVSQQAHFNAVNYTFGVVRQKMTQRAGKGTLSVGLAGPGACAFLEQIDKFKLIGEATAYPTVYGIYDNKTIIIRCPQLQESDAIYFLYKGQTPFEAAAVYAPFMPLVGVEDLPVPTAMLNRRSAVASMAALDVLVPGYIQKFKLTNVPTFSN